MTAQTGLFLDLDGTIADSLKAMRSAYCKFLIEQGRIPSDREFDQLNGPPLPEIVLYLKNKHQLLAATDSLLDLYSRLILDAYAKVDARPGAECLIATAKSAGFKVAIVTSNSGDLARHWISRMGFQMDAVVGHEDATRGKPHPDLYLRALRDCGCNAITSIAVEDSEQGLRAAVSAGIETCFFCGCVVLGPQPGVEAVTHLDRISERIENEQFRNHPSAS